MRFFTKLIFLRKYDIELKMEEEKIRQLLGDYFSKYGVAHIQIDSYNEFICKGIQRVIEEKSDIIVNPNANTSVKFHFDNVFVANPIFINEDRSIEKLMPSKAREQDLCYQSTVYVDIFEEHFEHNQLKTKKHHQRVALFQIPTMLKSCVCNLSDKTANEAIANLECRYDPGGYFIIRGKEVQAKRAIERTIVAQFRPLYNKVQVLLQTLTNNTKYRLISEIRSIAEESGYSVVVQTMLPLDDRCVFVSLPNIKEHIEAGVVFKALGISPEDIPKMINMKYDKGQKYVKDIVKSSFITSTRESALTYISRYPMYPIPKDKQEAYARQVVERELFPHLGILSTTRDKAEFLGYMIKKLILVAIGVRKDDDRDNIANKRIETTGTLMFDLLRAAYDGFIKNTTLQLQKKLDIITIISHNTNMTKMIKSCFATGNWSTKKTTHAKVGVSQVLNRMTYAATLSHIRHIVIPIGKEGKNAKIRQIHTSQFGFICPAETPEGQTSGIVTNFALLAKVSKRTLTILTRDAVSTIKFFKKEFGDITILLNGTPMGFTDYPEEFIFSLQNLKKNKLLDLETSFVFHEDDEEIAIFCDEGRLLRPVFVVGENNTLPFSPDLTWDQLVDLGHIRYVDAMEVEHSLVAMTKEDLKRDFKYDFLEIHPSMMLGVCASIIPFPDHSQSPRNCYQSSMAKQALGIPLETYNFRADTQLYVMNYLQRPLVSTDASNFLHLNEMPSGCNPIVAIMTKEGFNQEDSIILNKASIERGMFTVDSRFSISVEEVRNDTSNFQVIEVPHPEIRNRKNNYAFLHTSGELAGLIKEGSHVKKDDVLVGKVAIRIKKNGEEEKKDISLTVKAGEQGIIHQVRVHSTPKGGKIIKIIIRVVKIPEVGDKFASRAAQKGTCGMIFSQEDMPFTSEGITPDIIINPHCIPSRMTINQLMECVLGKTCALKGTFGDATPFSSSSVNTAEKMCDALSECGYERHGLEKMFNPYTGEEMDAEIFIGPVYYQRLKHMVDDKMHSRARGLLTMLTRQPVEGRSRDGGLRFGEMERDAIIVHGTSRFLKERLFDMSDPYSVVVCTSCGMISASQVDCKGCRDNRVMMINIPYAAKLLFQELMAMGIKTELIPKVY